MMRGRGFVCLGAALAVLGMGGVARAEDEQSLINDISSLLRDIKDRLDGVADDSSASDIDYAISDADKIEDLAGRMRDADPQTDKGKEIRDYYRDYAQKFKQSAGYLRQMKDRQLKQKDDRLAEKCREAQQRLSDEIRRYVEHNDPAGVSKIPDLAERAARDYQEPYRRDAESDDREMPSWKDYARNFSESGDWSDAKYKLQDGAQRIFDDWRRRFGETKENCKDIILGKDNPVAVSAMKQLAGNDDIRKDLIKQLDAQVKSIYEQLRDIDKRNDDGASQIQDAQRAAEEILRILEKLRYAAGEDRDTQKIAESWPDKVKSLSEALSALKKLKAAQHIIDRGPDACKEAEEKLRDLIKAKLDKRDEEVEGWREIDEQAKRLGETFKPKLEAAQAQQREMDSWRNEATRWNPPDGSTWRDVKSALDAGAQGTYAYYASMLEKVDVACKQLSWGTQHPEVKKAIGELKEHASSRDTDYVKLRDQAKAFQAHIRKYRELAKEDVKQIHELVCKNGSDGDLDDAVNDIADRWASQLMSDWHTIEPEAEQIKRDADTLTGRKVPNASKIKRAIGELMESVKKTLDGVNKGANDPYVKAAIQCGIDQHASLEGSCSIHELTISSRYCSNPAPDRKRSDCRVDCIRGCKVIELKPKNDKEVQKGEKQSAAYTAALEKMYRSEGDDMFQGDFSKLKDCVKTDGDKKYLEIIDGRVETYNFCDCFRDLLEGVDQNEPSVEIPDRER